MTLYRPFFDTSFNDCRQVRIVVQELSRQNNPQLSRLDFQR